MLNSLYMDKYLKIYIIVSTLIVIGFTILLISIVGASKSTNLKFSNVSITDLNSSLLNGIYFPETDEIIIFIENNNSYLYKSTYSHELCHRHQHYQKRDNFSTPLQSFTLEFECYIKGMFLVG